MAGDKVQFAIDIAAQLSGLDAADAELDALVRQLQGGSDSADIFTDAVRKVSAELDASKSAAAAAATALRDGEQGYKQLENAAVRAQVALEKATKAGKDTATIAKLASAASDAEFAVMKEAHALDELRRASKAATTEQDRLAKSVKHLTTLQDHAATKWSRAAGRLSQFKGAVGDLGGPFAQLAESAVKPVQAFAELGAEFGPVAAGGLAAAAGVAAVGVAVLAVSAAVAAGVTAVTAYGVGLANTKRDATLAAEALGIVEYELANAGMTAEQFAKDFKAGTVQLGKFSAATQDKLGTVIKRQLLGLDEQSAQLKKNFAETFSGLEIEGLLEGLSTLVALFDKNTAAGEAMAFLFEQAFQPIVDGFTAAIPLIEAFVLGILIGATKVYIGLKPVIQAVSELLGFDESSTVDWFALLTAAGEMAVLVIGGLAAAFVTTTGIAVGFVAALAALPVMLWEIVGAISEGILGAITWLQTVDLGEIGTQMIQGLINGITAAASGVVTAITGTVGNAITAAKETLGIASPSKVFAGIADDTVEGFTGTIESSSDDAGAAMADMVTPPTLTQIAAESPGAAPTSSGSGSGAPMIDLSNATFVFQGLPGAEAAAPTLGEQLTQLLEGNLAALGGARAA